MSLLRRHFPSLPLHKAPPIEIWIEVLKHADWRALRKAARVSRTLHELVGHPSLDYKLFRRPVDAGELAQLVGSDGAFGLHPILLTLAWKPVPYIRYHRRPVLLSRKDGRELSVDQCAGAFATFPAVETLVFVPAQVVPGLYALPVFIRHISPAKGQGVTVAEFLRWASLCERCNRRTPTNFRVGRYTKLKHIAPIAIDKALLETVVLELLYDCHYDVRPFSRPAPRLARRRSAPSLTRPCGLRERTAPRMVPDRNRGLPFCLGRRLAPGPDVLSYPRQPGQLVSNPCAVPRPCPPSPRLRLSLSRTSS